MQNLKESDISELEELEFLDFFFSRSLNKELDLSSIITSSILNVANYKYYLKLS